MDSKKNASGNRDYSKAKIYRIIDNTTGNQYIGSTLKSLSNRLSNHKNEYKRYLKGENTYITSYKILENGNYNIILIEEFKDCQNIEQLRQKERHYIESLDCVNKQIPGRTNQEYYLNNKDKLCQQNHKRYLQNKDKISIQSKEYYKNNREKVKQQTSEYYKNNQDKIIEYRKANKERKKAYNHDYKKKYHEINKEKLCQINKDYYQKNKDKILEKVNQRIVCSCGSEIRFGNKSKHEKSKKHQQYLQSLNQPPENQVNEINI